MNTVPRFSPPQQRRVRLVITLIMLMAFLVPPLALAGMNEGPPQPSELSPRPNAVVFELKGKQVASDVCEYTSALKLAAGENVIQEESLAFDDETCTITMQRWTESAGAAEESAPAATAEESSQSGGAPARDFEFSAPDSSAPSIEGTRSAGFYESWFEDPLGIRVNSVRNDVEWSWDGRQVSAGFCRYNYRWFSGSGWRLSNNNFFCRYENDQTTVRSSSFAHFENAIFCRAFCSILGSPLCLLLPTTHTYYNRNNAFGDANGTLRGRVTWRKSGGCNQLLRFRAMIQRTLH
jgi:hypothetical protein